MFAYSFPPLANAESIVTANIVRALEDWGWRSVVCTVRPGSHPGTKDIDLMDLLPSGLEVYRSTSLPGHKLTRVLRVLGLKRIALLVGSFPDESIFWYPGALLTLNKILRKTKFALIQSRSFPITNHFLGLYAKTKSGLPWLVHFSDPWIDSPFYSSAWTSVTRLHSRWERKIMETADIVTFTTEAARKHVMAKYPLVWQEKCHVIPHGFETLSTKRAERALLDSRYLNIIYLGSFYGKRTPHSLFEGLRKYLTEFDRNPPIRIWLIGRMPHQSYANTVRNYGIENIVNLRHAVPYRKGLAYAQEADVLLTIDTQCENPDIFLQSKVIEYLGIKKPIWGIVFMSRANAALLQSFGCQVADIESPSSIATSLRELVKKWQNGELTVPDSERVEIQKYSLSNITRNLASLLDAMIQIHS